MWWLGQVFRIIMKSLNFNYISNYYMVHNCYTITMRKDLYLSKHRYRSFCLLKKMLETYISYGSIGVEYDFLYKHKYHV